MTTSSGSLVNLDSVVPGSMIDLETSSRHYQVECLGGNKVMISGHPKYCPEPVEARIYGSVNRQGILEAGLIGRGNRLMFSLGNHRPVTTSRVVKIQIEKAKPKDASSALLDNSNPDSPSVIQ